MTFALALAAVPDPRPPVEDLAGFPGREAAEAALAEPWAALASCHWYDEADYRRGRLAELLEKLGWRDYYLGRMPCPVPLARFREME